MSKQANPTAIGAFVVGAVLLLAIGAALFGGSEYFKPRLVYVAYFEEQTKGLRVGSNVVANGVRVGFVSDIALLVDNDTFTTMTMVTLDILPDAYVLVREGRPVAEMEVVMTHDELVDDGGLRAQLEIESFITGQLLVRLDHRPDTEAIFRGTDPPYEEIPTIPSNIQEILDKIQNWAADIRDSVDLSELTESLNDALRNVADLAGSEDLAQTLEGVNEFVNRGEAEILVANLNNTLTEIERLASEATRVLRSADENVDTLAAQLEPVLENLNSTLVEADIAFKTANRQLRGDTEEIYKIQEAVEEFRRASEAVREFFDFMERNPESIIQGKSE